MPRVALVAAAVLGLLVAGVAAWSARSDGGDEPEATAAAATPERVAGAVTEGRLVRHLRELQAVADAAGGTRAVGTPGFDGSVEYVLRVLREGGYEPELQRFTVQISRELRPPTLELASGPLSPSRDYVALEYSGSGNVTAAVVPVDAEGGSSGCERSDFDRFPEGAIALMRRGGCFFFVKAENAEAAGAAAALVFNDGGPGRERPVSATLGEPGIDIPVLGLSESLGEELTSKPGARARVSVAVDSSGRRTTNVIAELPGRSDGPVVLLGAHLDSIVAGPGINDNGSGVAAVLEAAVQLGRLGVTPEVGIRFGFWSAEELGLHGSRAYAESLDDPDELGAVLNFDMLGSPNFARLVYEGDDEVEGAFREWFAARGLAVDEVALQGRSDHAPFEELGIPVGGLFTGADEPKPTAEARRYGGEAGEPHDACYHQVCDTLRNVDTRVLEQMADAAAAVALELAGT